MMHGKCLAATLLGLLPLVAGCTSGTARPHLQGKVTYHGKPVGDQTLTLCSQGAEFFTHKIPILADGTFSGQGPAPGTYKVVIEESLAAQEGRKPGSAAVKIPAKYRRKETTDLTWTIQAGENPRDIELTD